MEKINMGSEAIERETLIVIKSQRDNMGGFLIKKHTSPNLGGFTSVVQIPPHNPPKWFVLSDRNAHLAFINLTVNREVQQHDTWCLMKSRSFTFFKMTDNAGRWQHYFYVEVRWWHSRYQYVLKYCIRFRVWRETHSKSILTFQFTQTELLSNAGLVFFFVTFCCILWMLQACNTPNQLFHPTWLRWLHGPRVYIPACPHAICLSARCTTRVFPQGQVHFITLDAEERLRKSSQDFPVWTRWRDSSDC